MRPSFRSVSAALVFSVAASSIVKAQAARPDAPAVRIIADHASGVYDLGQTLTWKIDLGASADTLHYKLTENGLKPLQSAAIKPDQIVTAKLDKPGWLYLEITDSSGKFVQSAGAIVAPGKIEPSSKKPDDFDAFWKSQLARIEKISPNAKLTPGDSAIADVDYFDVTLDNIDHAHVRAQLARPSKGTKFPAIVTFQYAGVYALPKTNVTEFAKQGWLALNVMAHDLPLHEDKAFYAKAMIDGKPAADYTTIGDTSRESSYFRRMFLGDYQALEWLHTRPDWNGKVLLVRGESQGGMQTIALAGLDPHVTEAIATVPAGCDTLGLDAGRMPGWPYWYRQSKDPAQEKAILDTSRYYDPSNFAPAVQCPTMVAVALRDTTACPPGVIGMCNALAGPHELVIMPNGTHQRDHPEGVKRASEWFASLLKTAKPPL